MTLAHPAPSAQLSSADGERQKRFGRGPQTRPRGPRGAAGLVGALLALDSCGGEPGLRRGAPAGVGTTAVVCPGTGAVSAPEGRGTGRPPGTIFVW